MTTSQSGESGPEAGSEAGAADAAHLDDLYGLALRLTGGDEARAEQLVRETISAAYRRRADFEPGAGRRAWLMEILRDTFAKAYRERTERPPAAERGEGDARRGPDGDDPGGVRFERIADDAVIGAIEGLPEELRVPLVLSDLDGLRYREIGELLAIPPGVVEARLHRGRRRLRRELRDRARPPASPRSAGAGRTGGAVDGPTGGMECEEALTRVYEYLDGEIDAEVQERIHGHVEVCARCYPTFDQERLFLDHLRRVGFRTRTDDGVRGRIAALLDELR